MTAIGSGFARDPIRERANVGADIGTFAERAHGSRLRQTLPSVPIDHP